MINQLLITNKFFASESSGGIASLGIDPKLLLLQILSFALIFWALRRFAFGPILSALDGRYQTIQDSIDDAEKIAKQNEQSAKKTKLILKEARLDAEKIIAQGGEEAASLIREAEVMASNRTDRLIKEAEAKINGDIAKARDALKQEMFDIVKSATTVILQEKIDDSKSDQMITKALSDLQEARKP